MIEETLYDITIIGGGPNGLYSLYKLKEKFPRKKIILIEKNEIANNIKKYPNVRWHSTMKELQLPSILNSSIESEYQPTSLELFKYYNNFAEENKLNVYQDHELLDISDSIDKTYKLTISTANNLKFVSTRIIILCTGIFDNPNRLKINSKFSFCHYGMKLGIKEKKLVLIGAGNSAHDFIIHLLPKNEIHWIIRRDKIRPVFSTLKGLFDQVINKYESNLICYPNRSVKEIKENKTIVLSDGNNISGIDSCHILIGHNSNNKLLKNIGLSYTGDCLNLNSSFETSKENIYAFGSLMSEWDYESNCPKPTYVHNGNPEKLEKIIEDIISKEINQIFEFDKFISKENYSLTKKIKAKLKRVLRKLMIKFNFIKKKPWDE